MTIAARTTMATRDTNAHLSWDVMGSVPQFGHLPFTEVFPQRGHEIRIVAPSEVAVSMCTLRAKRARDGPTVKHRPCSRSLIG